MSFRSAQTERDHIGLQFPPKLKIKHFTRDLCKPTQARPHSTENKDEGLVVARFPLRPPCLEYSSPIDVVDNVPHIFLSLLRLTLGRPIVLSPCEGNRNYVKTYATTLYFDLPIKAQFRVLGMRSVSHSTFQPQCKLSDANQILYCE